MVLIIVCQILTEQRRSHRPCCPGGGSSTSSSWCSPPSLPSCQPGSKVKLKHFLFQFSLRLVNYWNHFCMTFVHLLHDLRHWINELVFSFPSWFVKWVGGGCKMYEAAFYYLLRRYSYLTANVFGISEDLLRILIRILNDHQPKLVKAKVRA